MTVIRLRGGASARQAAKIGEGGRCLSGTSRRHEADPFDIGSWAPADDGKDGATPEKQLQLARIIQPIGSNLDLKRGFGALAHSEKCPRTPVPPVEPSTMQALQCPDAASIAQSQPMALEVDSRLGHYHVTALIGEGGMGEVYQARDTKLDRDVALKVLPQAFTEDPDRLARFEREAKVLASLNHTNIGHIYGLEEAAGQKALVLELVEGPTLADRIAQGPIPVDEALPIAKQIAEALEAAHEQGVIHRDLKPANVKVRDDGTVKVLDFGLAKAFQPDASDPGLSQSPTISLTAAATQMGMVIGTAAYMAPEQAKGRTVDKRADVWAFGAVLYEMLTGTRVFAGGDVSETLAYVLTKEIDWTTLPAKTPTTLRHLLQRCLERDPKRRLRDIGDAWPDLEGQGRATVELSATVVAPQLQIWQRPVVAAVVVAVLVTALAAATMMRPEPVPSPLLARFAIVPPDTAPLFPGGTSARAVAISRDGTQVVYRSGGGEAAQMYLRRIDQLDVAPLRGAEGFTPFFSPDGEWVGFLSTGGRVLQRVSILGGPPVRLAESPLRTLGASWGADDQIIFGTLGGGLFRVSGGGGEPEPVTTLDTEQGETSHTWPFIIPGRDAVVFVTDTGVPLTTGQLAVLDLNTGDVTRLGIAGISPHYVSTGHPIYAAEDASLRAVPFDATALQVTGNPVPLVEGVVVKRSGAADFSIADNGSSGSLVYVADSSADAVLNLVFLDREGNVVEVLDEAGERDFIYPRLSPDDTRVVIQINEVDESNIWIYEIADNLLNQLTFDGGQRPLWSPDGTEVTFLNGNALWTIPSDFGGTPAPLPGTEVAGNDGPSSWSPDGEVLLFTSNEGIHAWRRENATSEASGEAEVIVEAPDALVTYHPDFGPDGRWFVYASGRPPFDMVLYGSNYPVAGGTPQRITADTGNAPKWVHDTQELTFVEDPTRRMMQVMGITTEPRLSRNNPVPLFASTFPAYEAARRTYDVTKDGRRLIVALPTGDASVDESDGSPQINVVLNWFEELKARVPIP